MRDFASCFSEYAVHVVSSDTTSSSCSTQSPNSCILPHPTNSISILNSVTSLYRTLIPSPSSQNHHLLITLTWSKTAVFQGLNIAFSGGDNNNSVKVSTNSRIFRKLKGSKLVEFQGSEVEVNWDLTSARYESSGPEPVDGYSIVVTFDSETILRIGGGSSNGDDVGKIGPKSGCRTTLISRREHYSGTNYSTRAQFCEGGTSHEIVIRCTDAGAGAPAGLAVSIDKKTVIRVKRLQWNFRGNQTIFLDDGSLVDLMWDVHDWFYSGTGAGAGVFMFRTRSGMDSRLWLEEKVKKKKGEEDKVEFSLVMLACKNI